MDLDASTAPKFDVNQAKKGRSTTPSRREMDVMKLNLFLHLCFRLDEILLYTSMMYWSRR